MARTWNLRATSNIDARPIHLRSTNEVIIQKHKIRSLLQVRWVDLPLRQKSKFLQGVDFGDRRVHLQQNNGSIRFVAIQAVEEGFVACAAARRRWDFDGLFFSAYSFTQQRDQAKTNELTYRTRPPIFGMPFPLMTD